MNTEWDEMNEHEQRSFTTNQIERRRTAMRQYIGMFDTNSIIPTTPPATETIRSPYLLEHNLLIELCQGDNPELVCERVELPEKIAILKNNGKPVMNEIISMGTDGIETIRKKPRYTNKSYHQFRKLTPRSHRQSYHHQPETT